MKGLSLGSDSKQTVLRLYRTKRLEGTDPDFVCFRRFALSERPPLITIRRNSELRYSRRQEVSAVRAELLKRESQFAGTNKEMDHYLWLAGLYLKWRKNSKAEINVEVRELFESPSADVTVDLNTLVPPNLLKAFRGKL